MIVLVIMKRNFSLTIYLLVDPLYIISVKSVIGSTESLEIHFILTAFDRPFLPDIMIPALH